MPDKRVGQKLGNWFMKATFTNPVGFSERFRENTRICFALVLAASGLAITILLEMKLFG
jgi:hypothetical protein